jgi:hypothetical protein
MAGKNPRQILPHAANRAAPASQNGTFRFYFRRVRKDLRSTALGTVFASFWLVQLIGEQ